jgi:hypothetical protein
MRIQAILALAVLATTLVDLPAQGRGRRGPRPGDPNAEAATPPVAAPAAPAETKPKHYLAIVGGDVYLGTGQRLTGASVLIADDKIEAVGHNLTLPEGTTVIDAKGKVVSPGFVAVIGAGMGAGRSAPFADAVNPFDPEIKQGLAAGITSFLAGSTGGGSAPSGSNAVIKLAYGDVKAMVVQEDSVVGMSVPLPLADREKFADTVKKAREYLAAIEEFPKKKAADANAKEPPMPGRRRQGRSDPARQGPLVGQPRRRQPVRRRPTRRWRCSRQRHRRHPSGPGTQQAAGTRHRAPEADQRLARSRRDRRDRLDGRAKPARPHAGGPDRP